MTMTNQETDTALILEGELRRRVKEIMGDEVRKQVAAAIQELFDKQKAQMMLEISINVGKIMQVAERENRKPLWETDPAELNLPIEMLNTHMIGRGEK